MAEAAGEAVVIDDSDTELNEGGQGGADEEVDQEPPNLDAPAAGQSFKAEHASLGKLLSSSITSLEPDKKCIFVIPDMQRPYEWDGRKAAGLLSSLLKLFHADVAEHTLGDILAWKERQNTPTTLVLNGQQRLVTLTLLLSLLRHHLTLKGQHNFLLDQEVNAMLFFTVYSGSNPTRHTRVKLRERQADFWATYIAADVDNLGQLWLNGGHEEINLELAGGDTINITMMQNLHAMQHVLNTPFPPEDRVLLEDTDQLCRFMGFLLQNVKVAFSLVIGGGTAYCSQIFIQSNWQQVQLKDEDMIKAVLLETVTPAVASRYADIWETAYFNLKSHTIPCLNNRSAFTHAFHIIREIRSLAYSTAPLLSFYKLDSGGGAEDAAGECKLKSYHDTFMDRYFEPVTSALNMILNWREINLPEKLELHTQADQRRALLLLDRIKTRCRSLLRLLHVVDHNKKYRPAMASWLSVAVALFHHHYCRPDSLELNNLNQLAESLRLLDARMFLFLADGTHWGKVVNIMIQGGRITHGGQQQEVLGALRCCCLPQGGAGVGSLEQHNLSALNGTLMLVPFELSLLAQNMVKINYQSRTPQLPRQLLLLYDDELRNPTTANQLGPEGSIDDFDYDQKMEEFRDKLDLDHILPKKNLSVQYWRDRWPSATSRDYWMDLPGNLELLSHRINILAGNAGFDVKRDIYQSHDSIRFRSTTELVRSHPEWNEEACRRHDRDILEKVARRLDLPSDVLVRTVREKCHERWGLDPLPNDEGAGGPADGGGGGNGGGGRKGRK